MNKRISLQGIALLLVLCFVFSVTSCKKKDLGGETPPGANETIRPVGQPVSEPYYEIIGPNGGRITSEDGRIEIDIPAGALAEDTEIGIQPLKNTAVSGIGYSYRLTPHGKTFNKKLTVRFHYKNDERRLAGKEAIEIVYQNQKGEWVCTGGAVNNTLAKTISVQTDHFSDWAFVETMNLSPVVKTLHLNETVTFKAWRYLHPEKEDDFLVPLSVPDTKTGVPGAMDKTYIVRWTLNGPGKLESKGSEAVYTAPSSVSANNKTATVTVELNVHGKQVLLISTVYIVTEGIEISINGGPWETYAGMATKMDGLGKYSLANLRVSTDLPQIVFMWPAMAGANSNGIYPWSMLGEEENHVIFQYAEPNLKHMYVSVYDDGLMTYNSGGFISVEEIEEGGKKYITGVFAIDKSGLIESSTSEQVGTGNIMGTFKVQRNW